MDRRPRAFLLLGPPAYPVETEVVELDDRPKLVDRPGGVAEIDEPVLVIGTLHAQDARLRPHFDFKFWKRAGSEERRRG
jgi:hypothetical protein